MAKMQTIEHSYLPISMVESVVIRAYGSVI